MTNAGQKMTGPDEAERRIAEALVNQSIKLDLSNLGLTSLPLSLLRLRWLTELDIGSEFDSDSPNELAISAPWRASQASSPCIAVIPK